MRKIRPGMYIVCKKNTKALGTESSVQKKKWKRRAKCREPAKKLKKKENKKP